MNINKAFKIQTNGRKETILLGRIPNNATYVFRDRLSFRKYIYIYIIIIIHDSNHDAALRLAQLSPVLMLNLSAPPKHSRRAISLHTSSMRPWPGPTLSLMDEEEIKDSECGFTE